MEQKAMELGASIALDIFNRWLDVRKPNSDVSHDDFVFMIRKAWSISDAFMNELDRRFHRQSPAEWESMPGWATVPAKAKNVLRILSESGIKKVSHVSENMLLNVTGCGPHTACVIQDFLAELGNEPSETA